MDQGPPPTAQVTIDTRRSKGASLNFSEILLLVPILSSKGNFRLWSRSLRRALDAQDPDFWWILDEGPEYASLWVQQSQMSRSLLALIGARVDEELQSVIASAHTPRYAWDLLKDHFTVKDFKKVNVKYIQWTRLTYNRSMDPLKFVEKWRLAMKQVVEVSGSAYLSYDIRLHQFVAATKSDPAVAEWFKRFKIDPTWSGSQALDNAFVHFIAFETRQLLSDCNTPRLSTSGNTTTKSESFSSDNQDHAQESLKRKASHIFFD